MRFLRDLSWGSFPSKKICIYFCKLPWTSTTFSVWAVSLKPKTPMKEKLYIQSCRKCFLFFSFFASSEQCWRQTDFLIHSLCWWKFCSRTFYKQYLPWIPFVGLKVIFPSGHRSKILNFICYTGTLDSPSSHFLRLTLVLPRFNMLFVLICHWGIFFNFLRTQPCKYYCNLFEI